MHRFSEATIRIDTIAHTYRDTLIQRTQVHTNIDTVKSAQDTIKHALFPYKHTLLQPVYRPVTRRLLTDYCLVTDPQNNV